MVQPNLNSFEDQLQRSADELNFKPSNKVWQGVENSLNNNSTAIVGASVSKSLLSNWILNILVPAVVLVGGGSIFYANYSADKTSSVVTTSPNVEKSAESVATKSTSENNTIKEVENSKETTNIQKEVVASTHIKGISDNQNNANAVNYSLGYSNNNQVSQNNSIINLLNSLSKKNNEPKDESIINSNIVFTNSDIEKISKKELEKNTKSEYQEKNTKSVDFTE